MCSHGTHFSIGHQGLESFNFSTQWLDTSQPSHGPLVLPADTGLDPSSLFPLLRPERDYDPAAPLRVKRLVATRVSPIHRDLALRIVLPRRLAGRGIAVYLSWSRARCPWPAQRWLSAWRRRTDSGGCSSLCSAASWSRRVRNWCLIITYGLSSHELYHLFNFHYHSCFCLFPVCILIHIPAHKLSFYFLGWRSV